MVVGDAAGQANTRADQEVAHDSLEASLSALEVRACDQGALLLGILYNSGVESVLWRPV